MTNAMLFYEIFSVQIDITYFVNCSEGVQDADELLSIGLQHSLTTNALHTHDYPTQILNDFVKV